MSELTLLDLSRGHAERQPDAEAFRFAYDSGDGGVHALSFGELDVAARRIAARLQQELPPRAHVLLSYPSAREFVTGLLACVYAGTVAVPVPFPGRRPHQQKRFAAVVQDSGASLVLTQTSGLANVREGMSSQNLFGTACLATDADGLPSPDEWVRPHVRPDDLFLLQYTSGSTSQPKGVAVSHRNAVADMHSFWSAAHTGDPATVTMGGWLPYYHDMGLFSQVIMVFVFGCRSVLMPPERFVGRPHLWLRLVSDHRITMSMAPNFAFDLCVRTVTDEQVEGIDLSCWRVAGNGAEPVNPQTLRSFGRRFASVGFAERAWTPLYGLAEATVFVSASAGEGPHMRDVDLAALEQDSVVPASAGDASRTLVSCGGSPDIEVLIVDKDSRAVLPGGRIGEIWVSGDNIARGYWRQPAHTASTFGATTADGRHGYLRTGDLGALVDGELYVTGRIKEVLLFRGRTLYPQDIEAAARTVDGRLGTGAAFHVAGNEEHLVLVQEVSPHGGARAWSELGTAVRLRLAEEFGVLAGGVLLVPPRTVQRTSSGKVRRTLMRDRFLAGELQPLWHSVTDDLKAVSRGSQ
jgi:acyl-CoA synthetase (AMP-forming)/AMP-acid ligase II